MADTDPTLPETIAPEMESSKPTENGDVNNFSEPTTTTLDAPESEQSLPTEHLSLPESAADGLVKKPFPKPLESAKPTAPAVLTSDQKAKYDALLKTASSWTEVPTALAKDAKMAPITDDERMFLTRECLLRYLRATKWNTTEAAKRLLGTLSWRREYGVDDHTADYISPENETGKQVIMGYDISGRPCLYLNPSKQNTKHSPRQIQHLVFMLERTIDLMGPGQETLSLLINFNETRSGQNATISQGRETLYILQNHYPERLGRALVINVPFLISGFFKLITPFIDPLTREKIKFNEDMTNHVPPAQLLTLVGGEVEFEYEHKIYWPTLIQLTDQRRKEQQERWAKGGKLVGEYENYLKGGPEKSLAESTNQCTTTTTPTSELNEKIHADEVAANGGAGEQPPDVSTLKVS